MVRARAAAPHPPSPAPAVVPARADLDGADWAQPLASSRPLSARSVIASTLLGVEPPELPSRLLVRSGELFGISEGTTRVALSRMVAAGELTLGDGRYRLAGHLLSRHARQGASRHPVGTVETDDWELAIVTVERRDAGLRAALRDAMRELDLAEWREGVWTRPANLAPDRAPAASVVVAEQCRWFVGRPADDPADLALVLWDLEGWARGAEELRREIASGIDALEGGHVEQLAPSFVVAAAVLRHLLADPLLPPALLPRRWPGTALREEYERYDAAFKAGWRAWFQAQS